MFNVLRTYLSPLILLFALIFLTEAATLASSLAGEAQADPCCQIPAEDAGPAPEAECSESNCRCLSCSVPTFVQNTLNAPDLVKIHPRWLLSWHIPSEAVQEIDYPPERS